MDTGSQDMPCQGASGVRVVARLDISMLTDHCDRSAHALPSLAAYRVRNTRVLSLQRFDAKRVLNALPVGSATCGFFGFFQDDRVGEREC